MPLTPDQQELVVQAMPLACWLAKRAGWHCNRETVKDLVQTAYVAMCRAAQRWDPAAGTKFGTYAAPACRRAVRDEMNERLGIVTLPRWLFRAQGVGHALQVYAAQARRTGMLSEVNGPESDPGHADDNLDAEAFLAWLLPADRDVILPWLGGETICSIAARRGCTRYAVADSVHRILRELRVRAKALG